MTGLRGRVCGRILEAKTTRKEKKMAARFYKEKETTQGAHEYIARCRNSSRVIINPDTKERRRAPNKQSFGTTSLLSAQELFQNIGHWHTVKKEAVVPFVWHKTTQPTSIQVGAAPDRCSTQSVSHLDSFLFEDDWKMVPLNQPLTLRKHFFFRGNV